MRNGGVASVTLDYLRPESAPTHGDERLRIAGTRGVIETALVERKVTLITEGKPPRTLPLTPQTDIFTQFARSLRGEAAPPLTLHEACRITEIAIKAQQAADTKTVVSLGRSPYHSALSRRARLLALQATPGRVTFRCNSQSHSTTR